MDFITAYLVYRFQIQNLVKSNKHKNLYFLVQNGRKIRKLWKTIFENSFFAKNQKNPIHFTAAISVNSIDLQIQKLVKSNQIFKNSHTHLFLLVHNRLKNPLLWKNYLKTHFFRQKCGKQHISPRNLRSIDFYIQKLAKRKPNK